MLALNKNKFVKIVIVILLWFHIFNIKAFAMVNPTADFYVNDYAKLLNVDTKSYIINMNKSLCAKTGAQIVVVTVPNLEGNSLEEYATTLFRKFGIGDKTKNNGVLLLLALEERQFRVEVGYGLEGRLNDAKTGRIQDEYIIPYLKNNNWDEGIRNGFNAILQEVSVEYNVNIQNAEVANVAQSNINQELILILGIPIVFGVLTRWVSGKFSILYVVYLIGIIIFFKVVWSIGSIFFGSILGFLLGMFGDLLIVGESSGGGGSFDGGSSHGGGGSSGGGRKF